MACTCSCCCGACCYEGGECTDETEANCAAYGGEFKGKGTTCLTTVCEEVACPADQCYFYSASDGAGGYYWIKNLDCVTESCACSDPVDPPTAEGEFTYTQCYETVSPP